MLEEIQQRGPSRRAHDGGLPVVVQSEIGNAAPVRLYIVHCSAVARVLTAICWIRGYTSLLTRYCMLGSA
jgi:hypothetical protein